MSVNIEWANLRWCSDAELQGPGEIEDSYENVNELPALALEGCVIEGTRDQWIALAKRILAQAPRVPTEMPDDDGRECVMCGDTPYYLSTRNWCDGCEEEDSKTDERFEA